MLENFHFTSILFTETKLTSRRPLALDRKTAAKQSDGMLSLLFTMYPVAPIGAKI